MATVLVIDDDTALLAACRVGLRALGHRSPYGRNRRRWTFRRGRPPA